MAYEESSPKGKQREFSPAVRLAVDKAAKATTLAGKSQVAAELIRDIQAQKVSPEEALDIYKELEPLLWRFYPGLTTSDYWLVTAWVYAYQGLPPEFKGAKF